MIYKIYTFQYEANKFLYGLGKGHQQYTRFQNIRMITKQWDDIEMIN